VDIKSRLTTHLFSGARVQVVRDMRPVNDQANNVPRRRGFLAVRAVAPASESALVASFAVMSEAVRVGMAARTSVPASFIHRCHAIAAVERRLPRLLWLRRLDKFKQPAGPETAGEPSPDDMLW
jgi:hypothetical protein